MSTVMYVLVNVSASVWSPEGKGTWHPIPGDEPHTYEHMVDAVEEWLWMAHLYGHDLESLKIYRLEQVPWEEFKYLEEKVRPLVQKELDEVDGE